MLGPQPRLDLFSEDEARLPSQRFPLGRALVGVLLIAATGLAAGLVAFAPI